MEKWQRKRKEEYETKISDSRRAADRMECNVMAIIWSNQIVHSIRLWTTSDYRKSSRYSIKDIGTYLQQVRKLPADSLVLPVSEALQNISFLIPQN